MNPALLSSDKMDWGTPQDFFDGLDRRFNFTLDVCATADNAKCGAFITPPIDSLSAVGSQVRGLEKC